MYKSELEIMDEKRRDQTKNKSHKKRKSSSSDSLEDQVNNLSEKEYKKLKEGLKNDISQVQSDSKVDKIKNLI